MVLPEGTPERLLISRNVRRAFVSVITILYSLYLKVLLVFVQSGEVSTYFPLTKGFLRPHQTEREGDAPRLLLQHLGHLIVSTAYDALVVDGLYVVADTNGLQAVYGAAFLDSLQKQPWEE